MGKRSSSASGTASAQSWGCGSVRWGLILRYQTHGAWVVLIAAGIILAITHYTVTPDYRPLTVYDAAISLPNHPDTVPIVMAGVYPAIALVLTAAAVEFVAMYRRQSLTMAIHAFMHVIWWAIVGMAVVLAVTEATKPWASRYRPDFLSRCKPTAISAGKPLTFAETTDCDPSAKQSDFVKDGRKSFPSGHSSASMALSWFTILYFVHALYWREGLRYMGSIWGSSSCGRRFVGEVLQGLFVVWGLAVVSIAWCIGVTRFRDNRHNIDDILGGFMVALLWMSPCCFIALGQLNYYQQQLHKEEEGDQLPITAPGSTSAVGYHKEPTAAPGPVAAPVRYDSGSHPAAAADPVPAHLHTLQSDKVNVPVAHAGGQHGVVPVADTNGGLPGTHTY